MSSIKALRKGKISQKKVYFKLLYLVLFKKQQNAFLKKILASNLGDKTSKNLDLCPLTQRLGVSVFEQRW